MKNHLKRIASPREWNINRKKNIFVIRPNAGGHSLEQGLALGLVVRDMINMAKTMSEAKKIINSESTLILKCEIEYRLKEEEGYANGRENKIEVCEQRETNLSKQGNERILKK